ncbi:hypothetical protein BJV78DRAFT_1279600 [Lactifluus subvellereus]|nr:hypothetical protein BJV78DRAFT_1279600 [Lactifluus subvellereus]
MASDDPSTKLWSVDLSQVGQDNQGRSENYEGGTEGILTGLFSCTVAPFSLFPMARPCPFSPFLEQPTLSHRVDEEIPSAFPTSIRYRRWACIRAFFAEGVEVLRMSIAVDTFPAILSTSIFLLFAGLSRPYRDSLLVPVQPYAQILVLTFSTTAISWSSSSKAFLAYSAADRFHDYEEGPAVMVDSSYCQAAQDLQ